MPEFATDVAPLLAKAAADGTLSAELLEQAAQFPVESLEVLQSQRTLLNQQRFLARKTPARVDWETKIAAVDLFQDALLERFSAKGRSTSPAHANPSGWRKLIRFLVPPPAKPHQ